MDMMQAIKKARTRSGRDNMARQYYRSGQTRSAGKDGGDKVKPWRYYG
jgi:hypothetical protein